MRGTLLMPNRRAVTITFRNGLVIDGPTALEVLNQWRATGFWAGTIYHSSNSVFQARLIQVARATHGVELAGIDGDTPADEFLEALDSEGLLTLTRKQAL